MSPLLHQLLFVIAVTSLSAGGWRLARASGADGLLAGIATAGFAAAAAVGSAVALGLVGLGSDPAALATIAVLFWAVTRTAVDQRSPTMATQLVRWWGGLPLAGKAVCAALAGAGAAYVVWLLRHPVLGFDALTDHLALSVAWVHNGRPGSAVLVDDAVAYASFPNTLEVLAAWGMGLSRTLVPALLVTPATLVLLTASVRCGLRELGSSATISWLAALVAGSLPLVVGQLAGPNTDLPTTAWLAATGALVCGSRRRPGLLPAAVVAAGLSIGTKTSPALLLLIAVAAGCWWSRRALRRMVLPLIAATGVAVITGGIWYIRDLVQHGSPLWPLVAAPWGDPVPPALRAIDPSFLTHISATLHGRVGDYIRALAGAVVVLIAALTSPLWARRRPLVVGATVVLASLLFWAASPYTGNWDNTALALGATRYLLPCVLAAIIAVAVAGAAAPAVAGTILAAALAFNLDRDTVLGFPAAPAPLSLALAGACAAAVVVGVTVAVERWDGRQAISRHAGAALACGAMAVSLLGLTLPVDGLMAGHAGAALVDAGLVRWLNGRQAFLHGSEPVLIGPVDVAVLTGARLSHPVEVIGATASCTSLRRSVPDSWIVLELGSENQMYTDRWFGCLKGLRPAYTADGFVVYAPEKLAVAVS